MSEHIFVIFLHILKPKNMSYEADQLNIIMIIRNQDDRPDDHTNLLQFKLNLKSNLAGDHARSDPLAVPSHARLLPRA